MNATELLQARYHNGRDNGCFCGPLDKKANSPPKKEGMKIPVDIRDKLVEITEEARTFPTDEVWHPEKP